MGKQVILTYDGLKKLEEELDYLKSVKRPEVAEKIKQARAFGDLSENSEYDEAKNEQAFVEGRIATIEAMLRNAQVIDEEDITVDKVSVGCTVKVYDEEFKENVEYTIVGSTEADPVNNKISDESPIGKALIGKKVGETVTVEVPAGIIKLKVIEIHK
ncbi:transcription elongation factor GreA [Thermoanaerobacterium sp. RBIITD]|uniref:transcription elongation factor GreA n=1 Tax=Thermoanaerobacterium sp. RBIITD TaxID=1550240 RepID=UPI000BB8A159|nr:transcription elongation factor GreA [Thermoanaerobacterium sp. RBIITD]SNX54310.1 transcription elongation factor GreA [Thermoanaerobacterium sp. RBIITD]